MCVCVRACMCACVCACVRACEIKCVWKCAYECERIRVVLALVTSVSGTAGLEARFADGVGPEAVAPYARMHVVTGHQWVRTHHSHEELTGTEVRACWGARAHVCARVRVCVLVGS
jgi:hypothetical protein